MTLIPDRLRAALLGLALLGALAAIFALPPAVAPSAVPADVSIEEFSAERAAASLRVLARAPRPVGSEAHHRTREWLEAELRALGLEPERQEAVAIRRTAQTVRAAPVTNVLVRIPGTDSTGVVYLVSHYDSVPNSPGAADAGYGVATILETLRALRESPQLRNDLVALITDAEELGLLGAQAFVDEHPWAAEGGVVLNFEARGHTGPVQMFRTTLGNGGLVRVLAEAAPYPLAESLANEVFRRMPNDTDVTVFAQAGFAALDFANVHGLTHYHTPLDNYANADLRTLQHHGSYALSLARAFGEIDFDTLPESDRSYFSLPVAGLVHYPAWLAPWLALLAVVLAGVALREAELRGLLRRREALYAAVHALAMLVALPLFAWLTWWLVARSVPEYGWFRHGMPYAGGRYLLALCLLAAALYVASLAELRRRLSATELAAGGMVPWALFALAGAVWMPGAAYLFTWPLAFTALGVSWRALRPPAGGWADIAVLGLLALAPIVMLAPAIDGFTQALTLDVVAVPAVLVALLLGALALQLDVLLARLGWRVPAALAVGAVALLAVTLAGAGIDTRRKKPNEVHYFADLDAGEAVWYSTDPKPDAWTRFYLGDQPGRGALPGWAPAAFAGPSGKAWQHVAPAPRSSGPRAELLASESLDEGRRLRLRLLAPRGTHSLVVQFPEGAALAGLRIEGREVPAEPAWDAASLQLVLFGIPARGLELEAMLEDDAPLGVRLRANILGLPPTAEGAVPVRPDHMMPAGQWGDLARLQRTLAF